MFERFTKRARATVVGAQTIAHDRRAERIGSEHLLLALYGQPGNLGLAVLDGSSVTRERVEAELERLGGREAGPSDAEALATLGIDLEEVRRQVEQAFGPGALERTRARFGRGRRHIPFNRDAKKVLALALREAVLLGHNYIGCEHLVLGMLHPGSGVAAGALWELGLRQDQARILVHELVRGRRAG